MLFQRWVRFVGDIAMLCVLAGFSVLMRESSFHFPGEGWGVLPSGSFVGGRWVPSFLVDLVECVWFH